MRAHWESKPISVWQWKTNNLSYRPSCNIQTTARPCENSVDNLMLALPDISLLMWEHERWPKVSLMIKGTYRRRSVFMIKCFPTAIGGETKHSRWKFKRREIPYMIQWGFSKWGPGSSVHDRRKKTKKWQTISKTLYCFCSRESSKYSACWEYIWVDFVLSIFAIAYTRCSGVLPCLSPDCNSSSPQNNRWLIKS